MGTPIFAGIYIRRNSLNLGREKEGSIALITGIVSTVLLFLGLVLIPEDITIPGYLIPAIYAGITYLIVKKMHGQILKTHEAEGGEFYSHLKAVRIPLLVCVVISIIAVLAYVGDIIEEQNFRSPRRVEQQSSIPQNINEEVYQITAEDLYTAYNNNRAAADNKYTGKTLIITGYIVGIDKDYKGIYYVILSNKGGNFMTSTLCYFPANKNSSLTSLQKGQFVSIKGRCVGIGEDFATLPRLNNCSLEVNTTQQQSNPVNDEQTEYYKWYHSQTKNLEDICPLQELKTKIIFGKKEIKVVTPKKTDTFIIVGSPKTESHNESTCDIKYNVYRSNDTDKKRIEIHRIVYYRDNEENQTGIFYENSWEGFTNFPYDY